MERYYYGRDKKSHAPLVTVCCIERDGEISRGISVCSLSDQPDKSMGRDYAKNRALAALELKVSNLPIHSEERKYIRELAARSNKSRKDKNIFSFRSEYMPVLSGFEKRLLFEAPTK